MRPVWPVRGLYGPCGGYRGVQPASQPHGNATHNTVAYVRVPATTMEAVGEEVLHANPKTVYTSQLLKEDVCDAPRNSQAVRDKKKYEKKKTLQATHVTPAHNFADEIQQVYVYDYFFFGTTALTRKQNI